MTRDTAAAREVEATWKRLAQLCIGGLEWDSDGIGARFEMSLPIAREADRSAAGSGDATCLRSG